jgi:hypothetical protein
VDSLINAPRPASPYRTTSSRQGQHAASGVRAGTGIGAGSGMGTGSTPPGSIPGTPAGRTSRVSNDGSVAPVRGHSALGHAFDMYVSPLDPEVKLNRRDGRASPSFSNVDYVDHSAELYELPAKVSIPQGG